MSARVADSECAACLRAGNWIPSEGQGVEACHGGFGEANCATGYAGPRCAKCKRDEAGPCSDSESNMYYRLNKYCEPCPCEPLSLTTIVIIVSVLAAIVMIILDKLLEGEEYLSAIFAPMMILVTFYQTLALLVDLPAHWPPLLKYVLESLQFLNLNIEMAKPECSGDYEAKDKLRLVLLIPAVIGMVLGGYAVINFFLFNKTPAEIKGQVIVVTTTCFLMGSVSYVRQIFTSWVCTVPNIAGQEFLLIQPDLPCDLDNKQYAQPSKDSARLGMAVCAHQRVLCLGTWS